MSAATAPGSILVLGATGTTGSRVAARLAGQGHRVRAAGRRATPVDGAEAVRFDWYDPATYEGALDGADRVYLVAPLDSATPADVMLPFLEQARASGVRRAVLLSSSAIPAGGPVVGQVHEALPGLFDEWAVLRPSWFMQNFTGDHMHARSVREEGVILTAAGEGRVAFVDADDIAAVAVHALTDVRAPDTDLVITGPRALSHTEIATVLTEVTGRAVVHRPLTYEEMRDQLAASMPREYAAMLAALDRANAEGAENRTTDTVRRVTGREPRTFHDHVLAAVGGTGVAPQARVS
ncbi:ergot alkaloid biosynthesis protein [Streptomyces dioscori]|uniref:Ergot alkaloid biosynthesis protein n=1 Tax=Streptomyces dioscori TaxID=2109333 RepID=A0A2P8Q3P0_9ACTN|nr:NmrA family NAD(P)-binding protein [Streptomyces dioscori]PSM40879.1 ergot alkaloid biosynthesis protein [Streptomyces dioscori]